MFCFIAYMDDSEAGDGTDKRIGVAALVGGLIVSIYMMRGRGPTTEEVKIRLAAEAKTAKAKRRTANVWGSVAAVERMVRPRGGSSSSESFATAQVHAIANPETADALQNLQKLLYTRTITDAEFKAAKAKLVGDPIDAVDQLSKLAELHQAGILGDVEFAAAKAKALGL